MLCSMILTPPTPAIAALPRWKEEQGGSDGRGRGCRLRPTKLLRTQRCRNSLAITAGAFAASRSCSTEGGVAPFVARRRHLLAVRELADDGESESSTSPELLTADLVDHPSGVDARSVARRERPRWKLSPLNRRCPAHARRWKESTTVSARCFAPSEERSSSPLLSLERG
nr:hypothetical protein Iba_chr14bCG10220 [Ipomoea batatas]